MKAPSHSKLLLVVFLCVLSLTATSQTETGQSLRHKKADSLRDIGTKFTQSYKIDSAIHYYKLAGNEYLSLKKSSDYLLMQIKMADQYGISRDFSKAYEILDEVIFKAKEPALDPVLFEAYRIKGITQFSQGRMNKALTTYDSALKHSYALDTDNGQRALGKLHRNIGIAHATQRNYLKAETHFEKTRSLYESINLKGRSLALIYDNLGNLNNTMGRSGKALMNYGKAKEIYEEVLSNQDVYAMAFLYYNIGLAYAGLYQYQNAINYYSGAVRIMKNIDPISPYLPNVYYRLASVYSNLKNQELRLEYVQKGLQMNENASRFNPYETATGYRKLGQYYTDQGLFDEAIKANKKAVEIFESHPSSGFQVNYALARYYLGVALQKSGSVEEGISIMSEAGYSVLASSPGSSNEATSIFNDIGVRYLGLNQPDSALKFFQISLQTNSRTFSENDYSINPNQEESLSAFPQFISISGKIFAFYSKYQDTGNKEFLLNAYRMTQDLLEVTDLLREESNTYLDNLYTSKQVTTTFNLSIQICYDLFIFTKDNKYAESAYALFEKNKASNTLSGFSLGSSDQLNLPDSLMLKENNLNSTLTYLETQIHKETVEKQSADSAQITFYENKLLETRNELERFLANIKRDYPSYFRLKYQHNYLSIEDTKNQILHENDLLINYHLADTSLFTIQVSNDGFEFEKKSLDSNFFAASKGFLAALSQPNLIDAKQYGEYSDVLTKTLFLDMNRLDQVESLIIIPDKILHLIPFEALVNPSRQASIDYKKLSYLIHELELRYGLSATLLSKQISKPTKNSNHVLGFAPVFDQETSTDPRQQDSVRSNLGFLAHTSEEVQSITKFLPGTPLLGKAATEKKFREISGHTGIIHIASHGVMNESNPLFSRLFFSPYQTDSINDGYLNSAEILDINIPAELVVLSACNTGSGQVASGEGIQSLANSFFYAGSKSLVMSLWTANDQSTATIISSFYEELSQGKSKSEALRNAKLKYLNEADGLRSHPYYWAHMVVNGNNNPVVKKNMLWIYLTGTLIFIVLIAVIRKVRQRQTVPS
ncbi:MAG: hypothetical protein Roseis2KO_47740 [Roseivirga sp.]